MYMYQLSLRETRSRGECRFVRPAVRLVITEKRAKIFLSDNDVDERSCPLSMHQSIEISICETVLVRTKIIFKHNAQIEIYIGAWRHGRKSRGGGAPPHDFEGGGHNIKCPPPPTFLW